MRAVAYVGAKPIKSTISQLNIANSRQLINQLLMLAALSPVEEETSAISDGINATTFSFTAGYPACAVLETLIVPRDKSLVSALETYSAVELETGAAITGSCQFEIAPTEQMSNQSVVTKAQIFGMKASGGDYNNLIRVNTLAFSYAAGVLPAGTTVSASIFGQNMATRMLLELTDQELDLAHVFGSEEASCMERLKEQIARLLGG
jgi:hypothetical protein